MSYRRGMKVTIIINNKGEVDRQATIDAWLDKKMYGNSREKNKWKKKKPKVSKRYYGAKKPAQVRTLLPKRRKRSNI